MNLPSTSSLFESIEDSLTGSETADNLVNAHFFLLEEESLKRIARRISNGEQPFNAYRAEILPLLDQEEKEAFAAVSVGFGFEDIHLLDIKPYLENPYYRLLLGLGESKLGRWKIGIETIKAYSLFVQDEVRSDPSDPLATYSPLAAFKEDYHMPAIYRDGRIYMSLHPHEIATMKQPIEEAHGKVLTYGCGLGYFAFMASEKDDVESVTIVENDPAVISLFKSKLLPRFPHHEKIHIVQSDALKFASNGHAGEFDYLFVDIYFDSEDALPLYLSLRKSERRAKKTVYWIEKAILSYFRRHMAVFLLEQANGYGAEQYRGYQNFSERLLCSLYAHYKNAKLETDEEVMKLLSDESLRTLAKNLSLVGNKA